MDNPHNKMVDTIMKIFNWGKMILLLSIKLLKRLINGSSKSICMDIYMLPVHYKLTELKEGDLTIRIKNILEVISLSK